MCHSKNKNERFNVGLMNTTETAIVFLTNKAAQTVMDRLREIHVQTDEVSTCYVLIDASAPGTEDAWTSYCQDHKLDNIKLVPFKISDIARELSVKLFAPERLVPGSAHLPLLWLSLKLKHQMYWLVEDDVLFTGKWNELVSEIIADKTDLLCSHIAGYKDIPNWTWWPTLKAPETAIRNSDPSKLVKKGFFPIYRISARALVKILDYQRKGWSGHFEVLMPTILTYAGYSLADLNSVYRSPVYSKGMVRKGEGVGELSSLRFRPRVTGEEIKSCFGSVIFHPIKLLLDPDRRTEILLSEGSQSAAKSFKGVAHDHSVFGSMPDALEKIISESIAPAQGVVDHYKSLSPSPFGRQPKAGYLRGIDFYNSIDLIKVVAFIIGRHKHLYGEDINLIQPKSYTEKINWSKLFREFKVPESGNKLLTKEFIPLSLRGSLSCPPIVWNSPFAILPENDSIDPGEYYLKSNHGSGRMRKISYPISDVERQSVESMAAGWLKNQYGMLSGEWFYNVFRPELMLDRSVTINPESISWNVYVFGGEIEMISAYQKTKAGGARSTWFNEDFTAFRFQGSTKERVVMDSLSSETKADIVKFALDVARSTDNVRVDFFVGDEGVVYLGEVTFTTLDGTRGAGRDFDFSFAQKWLIGGKGEDACS